MCFEPVSAHATIGNQWHFQSDCILHLFNHQLALTHEDLIDNALKLISPNGSISIILPVEEGTKCIEYAFSKKLYCKRVVKVQPRPEKPAHRLLIELTPVECETQSSELCIENGERHNYSPEFTAIASPYYLKL